VGLDYNGGTPDPMPHYLTFDIGAQHALTGLGYSVKVQGNGPVKNVQVLTTNDAGRREGRQEQRMVARRHRDLLAAHQRHADPVRGVRPARVGATSSSRSWMR
jgi:hypothetical protein